ncbi:hypothetical protein LTR85_003769 [Meristemomyces frigidus]|nr:hypothetical protein LTR85_003769 [Meristemomyces frigidus]
MSESWTGSILLDEHGLINDITLSTPEQTGQPQIPKGSSLHFLSVVEVARIPLHLATGTHYEVTSGSHDTERWFRRYLLASQDGSDGCSDVPWWQTAKPDSPLGILVSVEHGVVAKKQTAPRITELLFYASHSAASTQRPLTPPHSSSEHGMLDCSCHQVVSGLKVHALALSSDLACRGTEPTPPTSPLAKDAEIEAVFLPLSIQSHAEIINVPPVRKRKTVNETFDEAAERRKKARRKGGEGVSAAAASKTDGVMPSLKHRRSVSGTASQITPVQTRPLSRSPSVASSRPTTARAPLEAPKRSSLSRVQSIPGIPEDDSIETKNKDIISRIVMAGMRLYGLSQTKSRKSRASSTVASPAIEVTFEQRADERQKDDEYKLVYHQVFKGTCFAFRGHTASVPLQPHTEALRETVDKLLALFCNDPLKAGLPGLADEITPGGRKAFGTVLDADDKPSSFAALSALSRSEAQN